MQCSALYIATQQGRFPPLSSKEQVMTNPTFSAPEQAGDRVDAVIVDVFNVATITIAGFLSLLTVAATF
jgi:hypothetical protein